MKSQSLYEAPSKHWTPTAVVVDDDAFVLASIVAKLKKMNVEATSFQAVAPAIAHLNRVKVDFAIIDLGLPDGDGTEIITAMRSSKTNAETPVVVVTASKDDEVFMSTLKDGRAMFVSQKPIDWSCLEYLLEGTVLNG